MFGENQRNKRKGSRRQWYRSIDRGGDGVGYVISFRSKGR